MYGLLNYVPAECTDSSIDINVNSPDVPNRTSFVNEGGTSFIPADSTSVSEGDEELRMPEMVNLRESGLRRSARIARKTKSTLLTVLLTATALISSPLTSMQYAKSGFDSLNNAVNMVELNFDGSINSFAHHLFAAGKENNETYTFREMLKQDDRDDFIAAMQVEVDAHQMREHWEIIPRSEMPSNMKTIMGIWSFKRKRLPDGTTSTKLGYVHMEACNNGGSIIGRLMLRLLTG